MIMEVMDTQSATLLVVNHDKNKRRKEKTMKKSTKATIYAGVVLLGLSILVIFITGAFSDCNSQSSTTETATISDLGNGVFYFNCRNSRYRSYGFGRDLAKFKQNNPELMITAITTLSDGFGSEIGYFVNCELRQK
jgi:hypothetical protein